MRIAARRNGSRIIEEDGVRCFLIEGDDRCALIDTGMNIKNIKEVIGDLTDKPVIVLNTHADRDHVGGNAMFLEAYVSVHEIACYRKNNKDTKLNALYHGDVIDLGNRKLEVIDIPGHTPGSIGFYDERESILISGDPIQKNGRVFMFGEHRDLETYVHGLERLNRRKEDFKEIWPSHGDLPLDSSSIEACLNDVKDLLEGKLEYSEEERFGNRVRAYKGKDNIYLTDN